MFWKYSVAAAAAMALGLATAGSEGKRMVIMDNDWETIGFPVFLAALGGDMDVLALTAVTGDSWQTQAALHALATLEVGNLSACIPVYEGATMPLRNTPQKLQAWEEAHGALPYAGAFSPENKTAEAEGQDPTGGDPYRINKAAFFEGFPSGRPNASATAAAFMVESVRKYPGQVSIYAGGPLTNVALAIQLDPEFAGLAKELVVMGGFVDFGLIAAASPAGTDAYLDVNFKLDPEAAKMALTAGFKSVTIAGNVADQVVSDPAFLEEVDQVRNPYSDLFRSRYTQGYPFWDETAALIMADSSIITDQEVVYVDVDIAYDSPFYGNLFLYNEQYAPKQAKKAVYVKTVNGTEVKSRIKNALQYPRTCEDLGY